MTVREIMILEYVNRRVNDLEAEMINFRNAMQKRTMDEIDHMESIIIMSKAREVTKQSRDIYSIYRAGWSGEY